MKPTIPEVVDRFAAYYASNPVWGSLHCVLDEPNYDNGSVQHCMDTAVYRGDAEGYLLACILMRMSKTQRSKIGYVAERIHGDKPFIMGGRCE